MGDEGADTLLGQGAAPDPDGGTPTAPAGEPPEGGEQPGAFNWRGQLPEELREHAAFSNFSDDGAGMAAMAKTLAGQHHLIGGEKLALPGKNAPAEAWEAFYQRLGRPDNPEGYELAMPKEFTAPEGYAETEELKKGIATWAHEANLTPAQAKVIYQKVIEAGATDYRSRIQDAALEYEATQKAINDEFGLEKEARLAKANQLIGLLPDNDQADFLNKYGNDITIIRLLDAVAQRMGEDSLVGGTNSAMSSGVADAQRELDAITNDLDDPYHSNSHPEHQNRLNYVNHLLTQIASVTG